MAVHAKKAADRPAQSTARSIAEGVALSLVAWVIARVVVGLRWPRARNPFRWNPKVWSHWDTTNYLTIARHGRTFGACGTPGFPYPFFYHVRWCGTAAWLPAYPTATRVVHALGLSFSSAGFLIATALIDIGSRMDELIFQEFKGTGNMELILDRKLSDRRLFPAIDIPRSGTRKEEKLFAQKNIEPIRKLRRMMVDLNPIEAMETLIGALKKHKTNDELLTKLGG